MADLAGKVAVVTGASRGVGRGVAEGLAEAGATLYLTARTSSALEPPAPGSVEATAAAVEALGGKAIPLQVDQADDEAVLELYRRLESEAGRLDVLVNSAFQVPDPPVWSGAFWEHPFNIWDDQCGVGLRGCYVASALAARLMEAGVDTDRMYQLLYQNERAERVEHAFNTVVKRAVPVVGVLVGEVVGVE